MNDDPAFSGKLVQQPIRYVVPDITLDDYEADQDDDEIVRAVERLLLAWLAD